VLLAIETMGKANKRTIIPINTFFIATSNIVFSDTLSELLLIF
jgi:hypothetical protein